MTKNEMKMVDKKVSTITTWIVDEYELRIVMTQELLTTVMWQTELDSDISEASCRVLVTETTYIWYHKTARILHLNIFVSLTAGEASKQSLIIQTVSNWCLQTSDHQVHRPLLITNWQSPAELKHDWLVWKILDSDWSGNTWLWLVRLFELLDSDWLFKKMLDCDWSVKKIWIVIGQLWNTGLWLVRAGNTWLWLVSYL